MVRKTPAGTPRRRTDLGTIVRRHLDALNGRDVERLMSYYADDAVLELPASPRVEGRGAIRRAFEAFFGQWEERSTYDHVIVEGVTAAVEGTTEGAHRTLHLRISGHIPTGTRHYRHPFAAFFDFEGTMIVRHRVYYDARDLVKQLLGS